MRSKAYENYLEQEVMTADPLTLVRLLYRGALDAIAGARRRLESGDIGGRSREVTKALAIVAELARSLDHQRGGEVSRALAELYDYVERLLIGANAQQTEAPLAEAERIMATLLEAWQGCAASEPVALSGCMPTESYQPLSLAY
jgi:flagellar protein FliS